MLPRFHWVHAAPLTVLVKGCAARLYCLNSIDQYCTSWKDKLDGYMIRHEAQVADIQPGIRDIIHLPNDVREVNT
jgi:hypothetical protein